MKSRVTGVDVRVEFHTFFDFVKPILKSLNSSHAIQHVWKLQNLLEKCKNLQSGAVCWRWISSPPSYCSRLKYSCCSNCLFCFIINPVNNEHCIYLHTIYQSNPLLTGYGSCFPSVEITSYSMFFPRTFICFCLSGVSF